jgi:nitroreductase
MDVAEAIRKRRSIRSYSSKPVEDSKLNLILESARLAPSASNRQEWRFIVVKDKEKRQKLCEAAKGQKFVEEAPVVIACCAETDNHVMSCGQLTYPIDVAIAMTNMTLKAVEEGLGTCWVGAFYEDKVKETLGIPEHIRVVELLPLGYPESVPAEKPKKNLEEIVMYERWTK